MAAIETLKFLAQESNTPPTLMTLDLRNMALDKHAVTRLDNCPACSPRRPHPSPRPVIMRSSKKTHTNHGDRSVSAETTFRQYEHHISTITGIVDQVEPYHSETNGLVHTFVAGHLFAPTLEKDGPLRNVWKQTSAGRGMTPGQAKTGALCEALERYSGVYRGNEHRIAAKHRDIHDRAIHPNELMNFSERQYNNRKQQNIPRSSHDWIPAQFDESRTIEWTPVWSLTANSHHYVPTAYCYYGYPMQSDHDFCRADSNGNAAGNTLEEAILHGFMELIERDCAALWWYNRARRPAVDLRSFTLPYIEQLCDYYRTLGRDVWVLDITSDFQIPSFAALSASKRSPGREFLLGLGTHFDHVIALTRALTEMNQFLPTHLAGGSKRALRPTTKDIDYMKPDPNIPPRNAGDFPRYAGDDLRDDVMRCVNFSKERGMEMLVLNQTRSDVGLPVAKVIVPGLRQFWARFGPGRLYHIPVRLGWLKKSLTEEQLNPDRIAI
jgi:ribosomal protein S12 methylthiotransferase accessory factor